MLAASTPSVRQAASGSSTPRASRVSAAAAARRKKTPSKNAFEFSTPVCHLQSSGTTSGASSSSCATIFLTNIPDGAKTSGTSDQASTSRGPGFYEYWDSSKQELYRSLLWHLETGSPGLDSSSSSGSARSVALSSSFSTLLTELPKRSLEMTSWPSYRYTVVDGTADAATQPAKLKTMKLRLRPTKAQKQTLERWAGCSRFTYNRAVGIRLAQGSTQKSEFRIRDRIVTFKPRGTDSQPNNFFNSRKWLLDCPKSIRQSAVAAAVANVKACLSNLKAGNITHFSPPFRTKKNELQRGWAIEMDSKNVCREGDELSVFKTLLGPMRYYGTKQLQKLMPKRHPDHDPKLQRSPYGEYFLVLSVEGGKRERGPTNPRLGLADRQPGTLAAASLDPGVRKTLTTFSPENSESFMLGKGHADSLVALLLQYDDLLSCKSSPEVSAKERRRLSIKARRIRKRVFYLKKEFRDQTANFLARRYDVLLVPKLETKELSLCEGRTLKTKVVRKMMTLGHSRIFDRLREKCAEYGTAFLQVEEQYTSQTCLRCGKLSKCDEMYTCRSCGFRGDRDIVGAAGIFLKAVRDTHPCTAG